MPASTHLIRALELEGFDSFIDEMRRRGALSPATACAHADLPSLPRDRFAMLLNLGVIREGAPGTFYLFEAAATRPSGRQLTPSEERRRQLKLVTFWLVMIALPLILIELLSR